MFGYRVKKFAQRIYPVIGRHHASDTNEDFAMLYLKILSTPSKSPRKMSSSNDSKVGYLLTGDGSRKMQLSITFTAGAVLANTVNLFEKVSSDCC